VQHRGVDRYEDVDLHEGRSRIGEVAEKAGKISDGSGHSGPGDIAGAFALLQADQHDARKVLQRQHGLERHAALQVGGIARRPSPYQPDDESGAKTMFAGNSVRNSIRGTEISDVQKPGDSFWLSGRHVGLRGSIPVHWIR
jgi:hypothetical protein